MSFVNHSQFSSDILGQFDRHPFVDMIILLRTGSTITEHKSSLRMARSRRKSFHIIHLCFVAVSPPNRAAPRPLRRRGRRTGALSSATKQQHNRELCPPREKSLPLPVSPYPHNKVARRHTKKVNRLQRSRHPKRVPFTFALAHTPRPLNKRVAHPPMPQLYSRFDSRAKHARALILVRVIKFVLVRVRISVKVIESGQRQEC